MAVCGPSNPGGRKAALDQESAVAADCAPPAKSVSAVGNSAVQQVDDHFWPRSAYLRPELEAGWPQVTQIGTRLAETWSAGVGLAVGELARGVLDFDQVVGYELLVAGSPLGAFVDRALQPLGGAEAVHPAQYVAVVVSR